MKPCIVSFYMPNIHPAVVENQREVVQRMNPSNIEHVRVRAPMPRVDNNGEAVDNFMRMNAERADMQFDVIVVLDIDCIPLHAKTLDYFVERAAAGVLIGNAQRSNHIQNNEHVFAAPSLHAFSLETYERMGRPSFRETARGDMCEELTYRAEEHDITVELIMPTAYERAPAECEYWPLAQGQPVYGLGTTYGNAEYGDMSWHHFQIRYPGNAQRFVDKCREVLSA